MTSKQAIELLASQQPPIASMRKTYQKIGVNELSLILNEIKTLEVGDLIARRVAALANIGLFLVAEYNEGGV